MPYYIEKPQICGKKRCRKCNGNQKPKGHGPYVYKITRREGKDDWEYIGPSSKFHYLLTLGKTTKIPQEIN